ncbi:LysR family transcriptional regulator [Achromobacter sp. UMC46]|uniref:LysR family transcriptional regulator n=1 Tax=Achromobacter sp. UMC46 TaxID=1862319 RepID=UPI001603786B|nr:LysR family transcriptional regulator [Achromobacter sp. UMC46]MBB1594148.1 LysR family transcriptional regulator [Achromobacter sp. UMC46]
MDTLRAMRAFVRAVELGTLSAAAREQGLTQPALSKIVAALEKDLNVRLLERSTTRVVPTDQGKRFYERANRVLEEYAEAVADARGQTEQPAGFLRVNAPVALGQFRLNALIRDFLDAYPDIQVELILNDRFVDLVEEGVDVALRLGGDLPPNAIARKIAVSPRHLVAAPSYLARHGKPRTPDDLSTHDYVRFAWLPAGDTLELHQGSARASVQTQGRYRVNNALAIRETLAMGAGVGLCPDWLVQDLVAGGQLLRVLPKWSGAPQEAFLIYPSRRYQALRARLLIQFLADRLPTQPGMQPPHGA